jgi:GTPase SAR1 family protein
VQIHVTWTTATMQVGNKMDLEQARVVTQEGARAVATAKGVLYIETSAKDSKCVSEMFELVAASILDRLHPVA